jgi:tRNA threonylcarbamoyladenosine biosynthesis protein TsaE
MTSLRRTGVALTLEALWDRGRAIGTQLRAPALITLEGDLGAGKTTLVQAICDGLGVAEPVTSPTFALVHEYHGRDARVVHCDLYRLESPRDVERLGLDDYLADPACIVLVEWPDRAGTLLPWPTVQCALSHDPANDAVRILREAWAI